MWFHAKLAKKNLERYLSQVAIYAKLKEDERFLTSFKRSSGYVKLLAELDLLSNCTNKSDEDLDDEDETNSLSGKYYIPYARHHKLLSI